MFKKYYYCFIAGLPDFIFEDSKFKSTLPAFKQELEAELTPGDYSLVQLLFLPYDHDNLINHLLKKSEEHNPLCNFTTENIDEQISRLNVRPEQKPLLPGYMIQFIRDFYDEEKENKEEEFEKVLMEGYYHHVLQADNSFLRQWFEFELNAKNILTAHICRKYNIEIIEELIGSSPLVQELINIRKKNLDIPTDDDYLNEIIRLTEIEDFYQRERRFDLLKWDYIDEHTFFHYFTIEKIIGYLIKLFIVFRWIKLHKETGREMFEKLIDDLQSSCDLPEEFSLNKR